MPEKDFDIGKRLRKCRKNMGLTLAEVSKLTGVKEPTIQRYESGGVRSIPPKTIETFASLYECTPSFLMGWDQDVVSEQETRNFVPVYGDVCAGNGAVAYQSKIGEVPVYGYMSTDDFFALKIKGDSMAPELKNGDVVIVQREAEIKTGDIVIALIDGDEATCKKIYKYEHGIALAPNNPLYEPMRFTEDEVIDKEVVILGKVTEVRRKY